MAFKFLHASDLHLDTPFSQLGNAPPHVVAAARDASLDAFAALVKVAIENQVDFVVLAGDIYDGAERGLRAQLAFHRGLSQLAEAGIATMVAAGNHDPLDEGWSAVHSWPDTVTFFPPHETASVEIHRDGQLLAVVHGISFHNRHVSENLALKFERDARPGVHVAVLHANVGGNAAHNPYSPASLGDLLGQGFDYWALGHIHARAVLHRHPWVVYSGNTQGRSLKPSERGPKGVLLVDVDDDGHIDEPLFVPVDAVRFVEQTVDISLVEDVVSLQELLAELASDSLVAGSGRNIILRARLTGRGPLHQTLARSGLVPELLNELRDRESHQAPFVWWAALTVETTASWELDELVRRNDFVADLARRAKQTEAAEVGLDGSLPSDLAQLLSDSYSDVLDEDSWKAATALAIDLVVEPGD